MAQQGQVLGQMAIGINLDSAGFTKSLTGATRAVRATVSEMKAQMSIVNQTGTELDKLETKYNATNKIMKAQENELSKLHAKHSQAVKDFGEGSAQATTLATKINNLVDKNRQYATHLESVSKQLADYKSKTTEITREMNLQSAESASLARSMRAQGDETGALKVEYNALSSTIKSRNALIEEEKRKLAELKSSKGADATETREQAIKVRDLKSANGEAIQSQSKLKDSMQGLDSTVANTSEKFSGMWSVFKGSFLASGVMSIITSATSAIKGFIGSAIERVDKIDVASKSLEVLTGSAKKAGDIMAGVGNVIKGTPIAMDSMTDSVKGLIASGMDVEKVNGVLKATTDAAFGVGRGQESIGQLSDAFKGLQSAGVASLEDLNKIETSNVPALKIMANEYGLTVADMKKKITSGSVDSAKAIDILVKGIEKGSKGTAGTTKALAGQAQLAGNSISGSFANMKSAINRSIANIITPFKNIMIKGMTDGGAVIERVFGGMGGHIQTAMDKMKVFNGALKTLFSGGEGEKKDILGQYFKPETVNQITGTISTVKEKFTEFKTALSGGAGNVFGIYADGFKTMKTVIMNSMPAIKSTITGAITTFKTVFNTLKPFVIPVIKQIVDIFKSVFTTLKAFWTENGPMIISAITNIIKAIQTAIQFLMPIIKPVLVVLFGIIKGVISNIKGVIMGGLNVIMGVIKIFAGLFTGNFSKMWEGIKQVFSGAIKFVWNAINLLFIGRILKGVKALATGAKALVSGMWSGIKGFFVKGVSAVWNVYKSLPGLILRGFKSLGTGSKNVVSSMWSGIKGFFSKGISAVWNGFKSLPTRIINGFKTLGTGSKNVVSSMWSGIKGFFSKGVSAVWNGMKSLPSKIINLFKNMKDGVFGWVKKMIDNVKDMPHKMANGIKNGAGALKSKFKSMFVGVVNVIAKPVNGILGGINWVLDKVGATELPTWKVPAYAKGTNSHPGGLAMINDGKGKNYKEAVQNPDGSTFIAQGRNVVTPLQKGAKVLNGNDTNMWMRSMNMPHYANGIGDWFSGAWDSTKNVASKAWGATKEFAGDIWDYAKNPMTIVKDVVNSTLKPILGTMSKAPLSIAKGAVNTTFGSMGKWIKGIFEENGGTSGNVTGGAKAWIPNIKKAAKRMNVDLTSGGLQAILRRITQESNGSASIVNNWDSNAKAGTPSKGLLQYIQPTLNSWVPRGVKPDLGNGYTQLLAMFNDSNWLRDISVPGGWGPTGIKKYANGGLVTRHQIAEIGEGNKPEMVIPLTNRSRAITLLNQAMDIVGMDSSKNNVVSQQVNNSADNTKIALMQQQIELLTAILSKDAATYLDGKIISDSTDKYQKRTSQKLKIARGIT